MTDKVQKIKEEIERRINVCEKYSQLNLTESTCIGNHAQLLELRELKDFIDSLPEEPTSEDLEEEMMKDAVNAIFIQDYAYKTPILYGNLKDKMNIVSGQTIKLYQIKEEQQ